MTATENRERYVIATRRRNKKGASVDMHIWRPARDFQRTLAGTDPTTPAYQRSMIRAQDDYARFCSAGRPKAPLRNAKGSLMDEYGMAMVRSSSSPDYERRFGRLDPINETTVAWLVREFGVSAQVRSLNPKTRKKADDALRRFCGLPWPKPEAPDAVVGDAAFASVRREHLLKIRARFADTPAQADDIVKYVRAMYFWGEEAGFVTTANPASRMGVLWQSDGIAPMTYEDFAKVCAHYPVGTRQRLAFNLILFSGVRVSCLYELGPQNMNAGWLRWVEAKGRDSRALKRRAQGNKSREWKVHGDLAASISATPHGLRHFILREDGQPYQSAARLSEAIRDWLQKAGVNKSAHGIRKLGATMLADNGADLVLVRDFLGHSSFAEAEVYIRNRDKRRASARAIELMDIARAAKSTA
jgi:integrase